MMAKGKLIFVMVFIGLLLAAVSGYRSRQRASDSSAKVAVTTKMTGPSQPNEQLAAPKRSEPWPIFRGDAGLRGVSVDEKNLAMPMRLTWTFTTGKAVKSSPVAAEGMVFIGSNDGKAYALDAQSGRKKWMFTTEMEVEAPPLWFEGVVYIGSADGKMYALQASTGRELWRFATEDKILGSANVWQKGDGSRRSLVFGSYDSKVYALDPKTGQLQWVFATNNFINGAPAVAGDRLVLGDCDGKLHVICALDGTSLLAIDLGGPIAGSPAVDGAVAYIGGYNNRFVAVTISVTPLSSQPPISNLAGRPAVEAVEFRISDLQKDAQQPSELNKHNQSDHTDFSQINEEVSPSQEELPADNPAIVWSYRDRSFPYFSSPAVTEGLVIFGGRDRRLHAVDKATGQRRWVFPARNKIDSSPVVVGDKVVVGSDDGRLYVVNLTDGTLAWSYTIGAAIVGSPAVADGWVYIGADDGKVYGFQSEQVVK